MANALTSVGVMIFFVLSKARRLNPGELFDNISLFSDADMLKCPQRVSKRSDVKNVENSATNFSKADMTGVSVTDNFWQKEQRKHKNFFHCSIYW